MVEGANNGVGGSPTFPIWADSKWAEFFIYDVYTALGRHQRGAEVAKAFDRNPDALPRHDTYWVWDWWRPLRTETGGRPDVMVRLFQLLADHFPRGADTRYLRNQTWGEYLHSTSGAAGWWTRELTRAQAEFPAIRTDPRHVGRRACCNLAEKAG